MKKITIIMPFLNEGIEPVDTVSSIYATAPSELFNIIAIDDGSKSPLTPAYFNKYPDVTYVQNKVRIGVDGSRQKGADMAETPYIFIIDAHMRFENGWLEKILSCLEREPETAWCTTCLGLGYGTMDMGTHKGMYHGADILFVDKKAKQDRPAREVLEPKWKALQRGEEYEIPCILGANYGFSKKWFGHIRGLNGLKMWGSSEPFLSMKTWQAGGKCKIRTDIRIGHKFRSNAPYITGISHMIYNKIFMCKTILPEEFGEELIKYLPNDMNFKKAMRQIDGDKDYIDEQRAYYQSIFNSSIYDYCERFKIKLPVNLQGTGRRNHE